MFQNASLINHTIKNSLCQSANLNKLYQVRVFDAGNMLCKRMNLQFGVRTASTITTNALQLRKQPGTKWIHKDIRRHTYATAAANGKLQPTATTDITLNGGSYSRDSMTNVSPTIAAKVGRNLHGNADHPLGILKRRIVEHFHAYRSRHGGCVFASLDNIPPVVTVEQNFDSLLVPVDHVSRSRNDNYYLNSEHILRSSTSAHQRDLLRSGWNAFLVTGDVYRRDEIDRTHYPVFHQMEGVRVFNQAELFGEMEAQHSIRETRCTERSSEKPEEYTIEAVQFVEFQLKHTLTQLVEYLFGEAVETRWVDSYFPFTHPSWELEIKFEDGEWIEMLGCGIMEHGILQSAGVGEHIGYAFGLGLERFAMKLFEIHDIRLFWSEDERFLSQFNRNVGVRKFQPFSKYPPVFKDISFWLPSTPDEFSSNDLFEVARAEAGDWIEEMTLADQFTNAKTGQTSHCYRMTYRAMDRTLTDEHVNEIQDRIRDHVARQLNVTLR